jgi:tRNA pseudouridine38-40 synthase
MKEIRLLIEYDGTAYHGWQLQKERETLQGMLEEKIFRVTGEQSRVIGASRTDAGVHALGQVAVFRTSSGLDPGTIQKALNAVLPPDIRILDASEAVDGFHPRKDAKRKSYLYIITNQRNHSVFLHRYSWLLVQHLDLKSMTEAAQVLVGKHDFSAFMGTGSDVESPVREIFSLTLERLDAIAFMSAGLKGNFITVRMEADGFLRHMVRNIVGTLAEIGRGRIPAEKMREILDSYDRKRAGQTAPPQGLFLERILY